MESSWRGDPSLDNVKGGSSIDEMGGSEYPLPLSIERMLPERCRISCGELANIAGALIGGSTIASPNDVRKDAEVEAEVDKLVEPELVAMAW